jgi:hypothetical protein
VDANTAFYWHFIPLLFLKMTGLLPASIITAIVIRGGRQSRKVIGLPHQEAIGGAAPYGKQLGLSLQANANARAAAKKFA